MGFFDFANNFKNPDDDLAKRLMAGGMDEFDAFDAAQLTNAGYGEAAVAQNLGAAGVQDADFAAADAAMEGHKMSDPSSGDFSFGDIDFKKIAGELGKYQAAQKPVKHNMTLQYGGGGTPAPVQAMQPQQPQQAVNPMSHAMQAIKMNNMLYGAPQQQPQQQQRGMFSYF